jgi:hypothetical protein
MLSAAAESLLTASVPFQALPFAREIAVQTAFPLGSTAASSDAEFVTVRAVVNLLRSAAEGTADLSLPAPASRLQARFVAAVFQNLDLLYHGDFPHSDAVSAAVIQAVWSADEGSTAGEPPSETDNPEQGSAI